MIITFGHPILRGLSSLPHFRGAYLVGGAVRDLIMSRDISDIDVVVPVNPEEACRAAAAALNGTAFVLDKERGVWRATLPKGAQVDISSMKKNRSLGLSPILTDLSARDFTIDAMALPFPGGGSVLDPFGGAEDIREKVDQGTVEKCLNGRPAPHDEGLQARAAA